MSEDKLFLNDFRILFRDIQLVPRNDMTLNEQLNTITRLIFIIFLLMILLNFQYSIHFLAISISVIIIVYIIKRKKMKNTQIRENYTAPFPTSPHFPIQHTTSLPAKFQPQEVVKQSNGVTYFSMQMPPEMNIQFCDDGVPLDSPIAVSKNQALSVSRVSESNHHSSIPQEKLAWADRSALPSIPNTYEGEARRETRIKPVIVPQIYDFDYWKDNPMLTLSTINSDKVQQDMYLSGYAVSTCCDYLPDDAEIVPKCVAKKSSPASQENYTPLCREQWPSRAPATNHNRIVAPRLAESAVMYPVLPAGRQPPSSRENYTPLCQQQWPSSAPATNHNRIVAPRLAESAVMYPQLMGHAPAKQTQENYQYTNQETDASEGDYGNLPSKSNKDVYENYDAYGTGDETKTRIAPNQSGWVNTECGYNPEQVEVGLPSNLPVGNCEMNPRMKSYNENLFTQTVTPGVYTRSQVNEPINANIGISFQQQFEPVTMKRDERGVHYLQHDPRIIEPIQEVDEIEQPEPEANYADVYDPRFYGYGTSYRSYLEPVTGQTRFMYDDVNAVRMPNYVTRSKIDHLPYADTYGPVPEGGEFGNQFNANIRTLAQDSYLRDSLQFRDDITERCMRKINAEHWQRRQAPLGPHRMMY